MDWKARYLTAQKLIELVLADNSGDSDREYDDGRVLWAWQDCDLLLIDDVDAGVNVLDTAEPKSGHFIQAESFGRTLSATKSTPVLEWLSVHPTVWVLGDATQASSWRQVIASLMGADEGEVALVSLGLSPDYPEAKSRPESTVGRFIK